MLRSVISGVGSALPEKILTNEELSRMVDTTDAWINERTGIRARHIAGEHETTRTLATLAAQRALENAGLPASVIDLIIVATSTPDMTFPATATLVQADLGLTTGAGFDVQAVCSGFVYALVTADALIKAGQAQHVLVIGAETFSRLVDWTDRTTCVLFGDGAGAFVLSASETNEGIIASKIHSDGRHSEKLRTSGGVSLTKTVGTVLMEGREVFKHAVSNMTSVMQEVLAMAGKSPNDVDWFVPHQANKRILEGTARKLGVDEAKVVVTLDRHGNTSAASIPLAFDVALKDGRIRRGQLILLEAMGGGFTWGSLLLRY